MKTKGHRIHFIAAIIFSALSLAAQYWRIANDDRRWHFISILSFLGAIIAWSLYFIARRRERSSREDACSAENMPFFPEGQARLIDSGRLPNRYNSRVSMKDYETCHFFVPAQRIIFTPTPEISRLDPSRLAVRYSGGSYYYIVRPQEVLLPAEVDAQYSGEFVITSQRIIFLAEENGFEVPLQKLKMLDCSAHLVDFQVRDKRYTIQTAAACYAEKVLLLLLQRPQI